jgi:hypothetical protein
VLFIRGQAKTTRNVALELLRQGVDKLYYRHGDEVIA